MSDTTRAPPRRYVQALGSETRSLGTPRRRKSQAEEQQVLLAVARGQAQEASQTRIRARLLTNSDYFEGTQRL